MRYLKIFLTTLVILLIALRVALPYALLHYAEYRINKIPEYRVKIKDVDVQLYRGSYTIKGIALNKIQKNIPVPFFSAEAVNLSIEWRALLQGALVAKITAYHPVINFVADPTSQDEQLSINQEWQTAVKSLFPLNFNKITINDGEVTFRSFKGKPPFTLSMKDIHLVIENMQNAKRKKTPLPSSFSATAKTMDGAMAGLHGRFDPFTSQPTFDLNAELKNMQINKANNFLRHYTRIDVARGQFSLFVEAAAKAGKISGYAKPIIKDLKIINPDKKMNPIEALYKGALEVVAKILTNHKKETIATRVKIEGNVEDPDTSVWSIIGNLLRHAFIQALLPGIDHSIAIQDVRVGIPPQHAKSKTHS